MATRHWDIKLAAAGYKSQLKCDGEEVKNACAVKIEAGVNAATTVTVTYSNCDVNIDADEATDVTGFGDDTRKFAKDDE